MGMWRPAGFRKVVIQPDPTADGVPVSRPWSIDVLEELPVVVGAGVPGGAAPPRWLKVRAFSPDGEVIQDGFMQQGWLETIPADIDRDVFARVCLAAAQEQGTTAENLLAFADLVSGLKNLPPKPSTACGPFQITEDTWKAELAADQALDLGPFDRFRPYLQPWVAARIAARAEKAKPDFGAA